MQKCVFCKIIQGELYSAKVYEDEEFFVFMDKRPINNGHTLVVPKKHYKTIFEMSYEEIGKLFSLATRVAKAVVKAMDAHGLNIGQNNGRAAGQIIDHVHVHIIPRFFGDSSEGWPGRKYASREELEKVAKMIRVELEKIN
jgi:histidine triad (HIT) family protein